MKKIIISLSLLSSCTLHKQYSPHRLKDISEDMIYLREMLQEDYNEGKIEKGTAQLYFNLLETYAFDLEKEYNKANKKRKQTVYKLITITNR